MFFELWYPPKDAFVSTELTGLPQFTGQHPQLQKSVYFDVFSLGDFL